MAETAAALFDPRGFGKGWLPTTRLSWPYFLAMGTVRDRARLVHNVVLRPTPVEWLQVPLPAALSPAYYFIRPIRLLMKYARPHTS